jgi:hypothetical protein
LAKRSLLLDSGDFVLSLSSTGVSVARNHLLVSEAA